MKRINRIREHGQVLVLVALMMIGFLAMLALTLDGGNLYLKRREAQNAADAGALAGARVYCTGQDEDLASAAAYEYVGLNGAELEDFTLEGDSVVSVVANIEFDTFFAHFIGRPVLEASALAKAICTEPSGGSRVLPIAWSCRPTVEDLCIDEGCEDFDMDLLGYGEPIDCVPDGESEDEPDKTLNWENQTDRGEIETQIANNLVYQGWKKESPVPFFNPKLYVIMDSADITLDNICNTEGGYLECDLNNDGVDDLLSAGNRSWLDLSGGGGGSNELVNWIEGEPLDEPITIHNWLPAESGLEVNVFHAAATIIGLQLIIPVFDMFCRGDPDPATGGCTYIDENGKVKPLWHSDDDGKVIYGGGASTVYFHIAGFGRFVVTCVNPPGQQQVMDGAPEHCPGHDLGYLNGAIEKDNASTIEGFFLSPSIVTDMDSEIPAYPGTGTYIIRLIE